MKMMGIVLFVAKSHKIKYALVESVCMCAQVFKGCTVFVSVRCLSVALFRGKKLPPSCQQLQKKVVSGNSCVCSPLPKTHTPKNTHASIKICSLFLFVTFLMCTGRESNRGQESPRSLSLGDSQGLYTL